MPVSRSPSSGTAFHSLQATSQALQPMHTEVSVKNPIRGGCTSRSKPVTESSGSRSAMMAAEGPTRPADPDS
jgi:hypothetical protein